MKHRTATLAFLLLLSACAACAYASLASEAATPEPQRRARPRQRRRAPAQRPPRVDYSKFSHRTTAHQRSCDSCHTSPTDNWSQARKGEAAFPDVTDYPEHESCLNCHRQQFFVGARPVICTVCHTNVSPRDGTRHPFRNPQETFEAAAAKKPRSASEFSTVFPHDRHQDVMARLTPSRDAARGFGFVRASFAAPQEAKKKDVDSCSICHQTYLPPADAKDEFVTPPPADLPENALRLKAYWMKKGTLKTTPTGHASCFNCHWQDGGEQPLSSRCDGCHKLLPPGATAAALRPARGDADLNHPSVKAIKDKEVLAQWARRKSATFRHEDSNHLEVGCTSCHVYITAAAGLDADTLRVPIQTCASTKCHGARTGIPSIIFKEVEFRKKTEGADFQCAKCHIGLGKEKTPDSHSNLFPPPKPK